jgi:hypothetical protein
MHMRRLVVMASVVLFMLVTSLAHGQTTSPAASQTTSGGASKPAPKEDGWEFMVAPYLWATQINSKVTVKGFSADMTTYFSDIVDHLNGGFLGHFEATKGGKWGFFLDTIYLKIRGDGDLVTVRNAGLAPPPTRDLTLTTESWIVEGGGFYRLGRWPIAGKPGQAITVDALGGLRYWYMSANLDTTSPVNPSGHDYWVDPFVGARAQVDLTRKLWFNLRGDVGGFGVGSDFSWNGVGIFGYRFTPAITGMLGYRAMYVNYKKSTSAVRYEETFYGPMAGVSYTF